MAWFFRAVLDYAAPGLLLLVDSYNNPLERDEVK
jgi:hypothetical protein